MRITLSRLIIFSSALVVCLLLPVSVRADFSVVWDPWTLSAPTVAASTYGAGGGTSAPHILKATAVVTPTINPASWFTENATTSIGLSSFFTVLGAPEDQGKNIPGFLVGHLTGGLYATGLDIGCLTGSYNASVEATVNAGFAQWNNPGPGHSISGSVLFLDAITQPINDKFNVPGILKVGEKYPLSMSLTTAVSKTGAYQAVSKFNSGQFFADVVPIPEPASVTLSVLGMGTAVSVLRRRKALC